jgi:diguanylate cyclase (GGDEF)-like protein
MSSVPRTRFTLSLVTAGRAFVVATIAYAAIAAFFSFSLLRDIETDARFTREHQIPKILAQNVNALKVEKLASLVRSAYLAKDPRLERQIQVETRALSQSFSIDGDTALMEGGKEIADSVKAIVALRTAERAAAAGQGSNDVGLRSAYDAGMHVARGLVDYLATDSALVADTMSNRIEENAYNVRMAWVFILAIPIIGSLLFFWTFRTHVARPIERTIERLGSIGRQDFDGAAPPEPLFGELRMIASAVETYGHLSEELRRTNSVLWTLSNQDALTTVGNRRSFDTRIAAEFQVACEQGGRLSVLIVDLDHFKRINDSYGHQTGDACLRMTGELLRSICAEAGYHVARYGGEEFAIILPDTSLDYALHFAEVMRHAISHLSIPSNVKGDLFRISASIGVASAAPGIHDTSSSLISMADEALYAAKANGRDRVWPPIGELEPVREASCSVPAFG